MGGIATPGVELGGLSCRGLSWTPDSTTAVGIFAFAFLRVLGSGLNVEVSHLVISHIVWSRSHRS
jgi:hypothetical protein